ncbi:MAG: YdcF family protein [Vicingaceae bacterium]
MPITWVFILLILALLTKKTKRKKKLLLSAIVVLYVFSNSFLLDEFLRKWETKSIPPHELQKHDVAVVLGGFITYSPSSKLEGFQESSDRFLHALTLYKQKKVSKIFISGGSGSVLHPEDKEALIIYNFLIKMGIPKKDIYFESLSRNTYENALYSTAFLKTYFPNKKYLLITSAYHMPRAKKCFEKLEVEVTPFAVDHISGFRKFEFDHMFIPNTTAMRGWEILIHEWLGFLIYKIKGYA